MFHTARWDYDYTGGDRTGKPLEGLADKRVGIIGTGAAAVQCIPHLAASAGDLYVFQRTPSSIDIRNNRSLTDEDFSDLETGWQREWLVNFATLQAGGFADADLVKDGWTDIAIRIRDRIVERIQANPGAGIEDVWLDAFAESDDEKMNEIRARVDSVINDQTTAEALKPWYRQLCKRPCFHDEYLQSFNNPNTHLIDTDGQGVTQIDETGVWASGEHYELDCIILASGFEVHIVHNAHYDTRGKNGKTLEEHWDDGMRSLHGINVHGFPNLFILGLAQGGSLVANVTHNFTESASAIAAMIGNVLKAGQKLLNLQPTQNKHGLIGLKYRTEDFSRTAHPATTTMKGQLLLIGTFSALHDIQMDQSHSSNTFASGRVMERSKDLNSRRLPQPKVKVNNRRGTVFYLPEI